MQKKRTERKVIAANDTPRARKAKWRRLMAPFGYYGAKQRLATRLINELPPHTAWVEAFCGSAALTLAKKPSPIEVINDINGDIVNFFCQLRDNSEAMRRLLQLTPYAREELSIARSKEAKLTKLERARRFYVGIMMAINGSSGKAVGGFSFSNSYARRNMEARVSRWKAMPNHLELVAERLSQVRIEKKDAIELFKNFRNRPASLVYFDPPYLGNRQPGYDHDERSENYHERLLKAVTKAKCMVFISGYDNDLYNDYLTKANGWKKRQIKTATRGHNGKDSERKEIIWCNDRYCKAAKSKRLPINLTAKERRDNKINPER